MRQKQEFSFEHDDFDVPISHPGRDAKKEI